MKAMNWIHGSGRSLFLPGFGYLPGEVRPDRGPVIWAEVQAGELPSALFLDCDAEGNRDPFAPSVHAGLRDAETANKAGLKTAPVKESGPVRHSSSIAKPNLLGSVHLNLKCYELNAPVDTGGMTNPTSFGFGARLRAARLARNMSGEELGKGCGADGGDASKASVSAWEHDRHYPKADQLRIICLKLNVSSDELIFGDLQAEKNVLEAASAVQALTDAQRTALFQSMMAPPSPAPSIERTRPAAKKQTPASLPAPSKQRASKKA